MSTALIYHPIYLRHDTGDTHPERASRLQAILRKLKQTSFIDKLELVEPKIADLKDVELVHPKDHILSIRDACKSAPVNLDPDTPVSKDSYEAALFAAGGVIEAINHVHEEEVDNAFCMVRPPGHHACPSRAMGFCLFNNIAIGARYILEYFKLKRVLIVDFDVHHGNGTQEVFYDDPSVLYISLHEYPHYPGTGSKDEEGEGKGKGFNLNIPMSSGSGDKEYIDMFNNVIAPKVDDFQPEFILLSAGFDGHKDDPLSSITLTDRGYYEMTSILKDLAEKYSQDRLVSVLEGGYNLISLANSTYSHLQSLTN
ncbi:MAG: histone deacetylase [Candidatus Omnitrophota bacterium]